MWRLIKRFIKNSEPKIFLLNKLHKIIAISLIRKRNLLCILPDRKGNIKILKKNNQTQLIN